ncbi:MAG: FAD-dependent oxidoreductase [Bauldia sp.]
MRRFDAIVLGAGIVGVSAAWHLLRRGKSVALIDRRGPGEETSYGNAGVVERDGFLPMSFPQSLKELLRLAANNRPQLHYHPGFLPSAAGYLMQMRDASAPSRRPAYAAAMAPLMMRAVEEHRELATAANAGSFFRDTGGLRLYRTEAGFLAGKPPRDFADQYGAKYRILTPDAVADLEPNLAPVFHRAIWWNDAVSVSSPGGVTRAYADQFAREGGAILTGDARTLAQVDGLWQADTAEGLAIAPVAVVALGPWTVDVLKPLGYRFPFGVIRGYHRHFRPIGNASLSRPIVDLENGFVITPMEQGIRLTTGYEFADRDAPPTPVQVARDLPLARQLFPVGEAIDEPWLGRRPCLPDSLPLIGPAPRHPGLFVDTGHSHLGFTLGPVTGRLMAEMIAGEKPFADPAPFSPTRFTNAWAG